MSKFKINDMVICTKKCIDFSWYFTTPTRIINYPVDSVLVLEGFGGGGFGEDLFELAPTPKFEVGNYVTYKAVGYDKWKIKKIIKIKDEIAFFSESKWINIKYLTLVCNFVKGQEVECCMCEGYEHWMFCENFVCYCPELKMPFITVDDTGNVNNWIYAREIKPKYKAYTEPKFEWIGKEVKHKSGSQILEIRGFVKDNDNTWFVYFKTCIMRKSLTLMFNNMQWLDGEPFGDKK